MGRVPDGWGGVSLGWRRECRERVMEVFHGVWKKKFCCFILFTYLCKV